MRATADLLAALISALVPLLPVQLTACAMATDPYEREGTWSATGVNDANLRVMVADPHDLAVGRGEDNSLAVEAVPPVGRLLTGQRLPLSNESASGLGSNTQSSPSATGQNGNAGATQ
jgi:hypothetical protein